MVTKDGFQFVQGLIPVKLHKELLRVSFETGLSKAEIMRQGISLYLDSKSAKHREMTQHEQNRNS